jgi:hypothetical protein
MNFTLSIENSEKGENSIMKNILITTGEYSVDNIVQTPQLRYEKFVMDRLISELSNYSIYYNPYSNLILWINPQKKEWRINLNNPTTPYINKYLLGNFADKMGLDTGELIILLSTYFKTIFSNVRDTLQKINTNIKCDLLNHILNHDMDITEILWVGDISNDLMDDTIEYGIKINIF